MDFAGRNGERQAVEDRLAGDGRVEVFNLEHLLLSKLRNERLLQLGILLFDEHGGDFAEAADGQIGMPSVEEKLVFSTRSARSVLQV